MARTVSYKGFSIYEPSTSSSKDILIFTHGSFKTKNARYTEVPADATLYFYTFRKDYGTAGQTTAMLNNADVVNGVTSPNAVMNNIIVPTGITDLKGNPISAQKTVPVPGGFGDGSDPSIGQFKMTDGRVTSIAGPGSNVWDYDLSYNESSQNAIDTAQLASKSIPNWQGRDIFVINNGGNDMRLSDVFKALAGRGYVRYHYGACRVESATGFKPWDASNKVSG